MSTHCRPEKRQRAAHAAAVLSADDRVREVDVLGPDEDPTQSFVLDVVLSRQTEGFSTDLVDELAFDLTVRQVQPQGPFWTALLIV